MPNPTRWGNAPVLFSELRAGHPGIPAIPLYRPFAGWVARGWRREKYLFMRPAAGEHKLYYLYATAGKAPAGVFDRDLDNLAQVFLRSPGDFSSGYADTELARRQADPASQVKSAVVGLGVLGYIADPGEEPAWIFAGGALLPEPIPLGSLVNRPYGGVFYPFGREGR